MHLIIAFVKAPESGPYTFFISSDDDSEFWISTDETKANAKKILKLINKWTNHNQWNKYVFLTYIHTYTHTYIHTHIHTYIHTYVRTYVRTYVQTYIHTSSLTH